MYFMMESKDKIRILKLLRSKKRGRRGYNNKEHIPLSREYWALGVSFGLGYVSLTLCVFLMGVTPPRFVIRFLASESQLDTK